MILILTTESGDFSHHGIVDYLNYYNANYLIISGEMISNGDCLFSVKSGDVYISEFNISKEVSCVYYRRWYTPKKEMGKNNIFRNSINNEISEIKDYLTKYLSRCVWIPKPENVYICKLHALDVAKDCDLKVPDYLVTNSKNDLIDFFDKNKGGVITKAIGNLSPVKMEGSNFYSVSMYAKEIDKKLVNCLPDRFFPSFFQKVIFKSFELRVFYFLGEIVSSAILSQDYAVSSVDSRAYDEEQGVSPSIVPYDLPDKHKVKIDFFMKKLGLNIGSLDFIVDKDGELFFLEVNPVGQISGYSIRSGQNIEKTIVEKLMDIDNEYQKKGPNIGY